MTWAPLTWAPPAGAPPRSPTVADQLRHALRTLTPAERRVARALLAVYPAAGLGTVASLAEEAATSTATVVRLVQKLGYAGFPELQSSLRQELSGRGGAGPLDRLASAATPGPDFLSSMAAELGTVVSSIAATVPQSELDAAVELLADTSRRVLVAGGRASHSLAEVLVVHLDRLRAGTVLLPRDRLGRRVAVLDLGSRDVVVLFDFRRYESVSVELAARAEIRRSRLVVVTDTLLSPAARHAAVVLPVAIESSSPLDSMVAALALVEVVVLATMHAIGLSARERLEEWEVLMAGEILA